MSASDRDRKIEIQQLVTSTNADNQTVETWTPFASPFAQYIPTPGGEAFEGNQVVSSQRARFVIPWRAGLSESMRIVYGGEVYGILSLGEVGYRDEIDITAEVRRDGA